MCAQVSKSALHQRNKKAVDVKVAILGLNRTTGSLGLALRGFSSRPNAEVIFTVVGNDEDREVMKTAHRMGVIDNFHTSIQKALEGADIVLFDEPLSQQADMFQKMIPGLKAGAVVVDLSPLKAPGVELARQHFPRDADGDPSAYLVGATPILGFDSVYQSDHSIEAADEMLFHGSDMLIAPDAKVPADAVKVVNDIADFLHMSPRFSDPAEHDAIMAMAEGMPTLLSLVFVQMLSQSPSKLDLWRASNAAFASVVQPLHHVSADDLHAFVMNSKDDLVQQLEQLGEAIEYLRELLADPDPDITKSTVKQIHDSFVEWEVRREQRHWDRDAKDTTGGLYAGLGLGQMFRLGRNKKEDEE